MIRYTDSGPVSVIAEIDKTSDKKGKRHIILWWGREWWCSASVSIKYYEGMRNLFDILMEILTMFPKIKSFVSNIKFIKNQLR